MKKRSCYSAADEHCGRYAIVTRDVKDCYPNISERAFLNELITLGFRGDTAILLTSLMIVRDRIPQGSPTSGDALNIYLFRTDASIEEQATKIRGTYTRSADDMVISVRRKEAVNAAVTIIESSIANLGLTVNDKKAMKNGLQLRHQTQSVHNIGVNSRGGTTVSDDRRNKAVACAEGFVRGAKAVTLTSLVGLAARRERLLGHYHDTHQAKFGPAAHLKTQLRIGDQLVVRRLRSLGLKCSLDK